MLIFASLVLASLVGLCIPVATIQYGEFSSLLVDRNMENHTSTKTVILELFGGGKVL